PVRAGQPAAPRHRVRGASPPAPQQRDPRCCLRRLVLATPPTCTWTTSRSGSRGRVLYWASGFIDLRRRSRGREGHLLAQRGGCASLHQPGNIIGLSGALWGETLQAEQLASQCCCRAAAGCGRAGLAPRQLGGAKDPPALRDALLAADWAAFVDAGPGVREGRLSHQMPHNVRLLYAFAGCRQGRALGGGSEARGRGCWWPDGALRGPPATGHESYIESRTRPAAADGFISLAASFSASPAGRIANGVEGPASRRPCAGCCCCCWAAAAVGLACFACCWAACLREAPDLT
uniref:Uncharacterized protein n=1 Tax=Macrostomum lignano TaxID=282301 RepID=A0A1I8J4D4_9PLAT